MFGKLKENLINLFFPEKCVICSKQGAFLCPNCFAKLTLIETQTCPRCNRISTKGRLCPRCRPKVALSGVVSWSYFKDQNIKDLIHAYKYEKLSAMAPLLAEQLINLINKNQLKFDLIAFVPLSRKRLAWRGFNQAELLALEISTKTGKAVVTNLKKNNDTKTQVGLAKKQREKNLSSAFELSNGEKLVGKRILLVDDVITTGTTLNEVAKVLRRAGAREVWAIVLAKE